MNYMAKEMATKIATDLKRAGFCTQNSKTHFDHYLTTVRTCTLIKVTVT